MTDERRLEILDKIHYLKGIFEIHSTKKIIQDEAKRAGHLFAIVDMIRELEAELQDDIEKLN